MWKPLASAVQPGWQPICRQRPKLHLWSSEGHSEKKMDSQGMLNKLKLSQLVKCQVISPGHAKMQKSMGIDYLSMQCQVEVTFSFICVWPSCAPNLQHNWMGSPCLVGSPLASRSSTLSSAPDCICGCEVAGVLGGGGEEVRHPARLHEVPAAKGRGTVHVQPHI